MLNIQNINDTECLKCLARYLYPTDYNPLRIRKAARFCKKLDLKVIKIIVKVRDILKTEKNNSIGTSVFGYENKEKYPIYVSNNTFKKHIDLLLIVEEGKRHYALIKYFNTCMYDHTLQQLIYADFESILLPEESGKQNPNEPYTNKYKKICCLQLWL